MRQRLEALKRAGYHPASIIDGGAYEGAFARLCRDLWPEAYILMVDALPTQGQTLSDVARDIGNADVEMALLGECEAENVAFHIVKAGPAEHVIRTGSSRYSELTDFAQETVGLRQQTLDALGRKASRDFSLIKLDLQGSEIDALAGGREIVSRADFILIEVSLVQYNRGAPIFHEVVSYLYGAGFVLFDVIEENFRDDKLFQIDCLFTKKASPFRLCFDRSNRS